jgi:hypothetical protein
LSSQHSRQELVAQKVAARLLLHEELVTLRRAGEAALKHERQAADAAATRHTDEVFQLLHKQHQLESQSPVSAIALLQATRANRMTGSAPTGTDSPFAAVSKVSPIMATTVEALRATIASGPFQVPIALEDALTRCDATQAELNQLNAALADTSAGLAADITGTPPRSVARKHEAATASLVTARDVARAAYTDAVATFQSQHSMPTTDAAVAHAFAVATQFATLADALDADGEVVLSGSRPGSPSFRAGSVQPEDVRCAFSTEIYTRGSHWFPYLLA